MKQILILIFSVYFCNITVAQNSIEELADVSNKRTSNHPSELIYLQTSKGIYETGEDLWFKAYQLDAQIFSLSDKSKTLYLQMINSKDSVVWQEKYLIENGIADGHVYIDEKLPEGDYILEGYTRHSFHQNDTAAMTGTRKIKVVNNIARTEINGSTKDEEFRFTTFPEGGDLIYGILSKLAFKATDGKGNPLDVDGTLYQDDNPLTKLKSTHDGMGKLLFTPRKGFNYRIELNNGKSYQLPKIHSEGVVIRLANQDKEHLNFIISQSNALPNQQIYLMGQMRGMVCCIAKAVLNDNLNIKIPLTNFAYQGIAEFTLFNAAMQPIAQRLVYLNSEKKLIITAEPEKESFAIREKATIKIKVTDEYGNPVKANLGVSVFDHAYENPTDPTNILTHCYLSSQIRGNIYNPSYYFNEENTDRLTALDLLLLTQGWRRYVWDTTNSTASENMFLTDEILVTQTIDRKKKSDVLQGTEQLIQASGAEATSLFVWGDSLGRFTITTEIMKELRGSYIYIKPMLSKEFRPILSIPEYFTKIDSIRKTKPTYHPIADMTQYEREPIFDLPLISKDSAIMIDEVTVKGRGQNPFRDKFLGQLNNVAQMNSGPWVCKHGWLENYKEGYTHHHDPRFCPCVVDDGEPRTAPVIGKTYTIMKAEYYQCNVQGGWCFKPLDHRKVVYQGAIYTEEDLLRMNNLCRTKGYYSTREFYQPDDIDIQVLIPDARNTLLWEPSVITDEKGEATVAFYCSDINTKFRVNIEGTNGLGQLGAKKCEFRVIKKI